VDVGIEDLDLRVLGHLSGRDVARAADVDREDLRLLRVESERNLLQVQDDVGHILLNARDRGELVQHPLDVDGGDRRPLDRRQQATAKSVANGRRETPLERLRGEAAVRLGQGVAVDLQALGALKTFPKHK
jgi:hypothetical protein